jgi:hypothetical protein
MADGEVCVITWISPQYKNHTDTHMHTCFIVAHRGTNAHAHTRTAQHPNRPSIKPNPQ